MEHLLQVLSHLTEPEILVRYSKYLLIIVAVYSFIEVVFPPIPGDALLVLSGSLAGRANINPLWVICFAFIGSFIGSWLLYSLGYKMERKMLDSPRFSKLMDSKVFLRVERWFKRFGFLTVLVSRFIPVVRSGVILAAGIAGMDRRKSMLAVGASILLSSSLLVFGGRLVGRRWEKLVALWHSQFRFIFFVIAGVALTYLIVYQVFKYFKTKVKGRKLDD